MLMHWAQSDALSKNIQASYGSRPVEYEVLVMISRIVETVAALGPAIQEDERNVIGPWLHGLVKKAEKSKWLSRLHTRAMVSD